jgi:hypothetical protein
VGKGRASPRGRRGRQGNKSEGKKGPREISDHRHIFAPWQAALAKAGSARHARTTTLPQLRVPYSAISRNAPAIRRNVRWAVSAAHRHWRDAMPIARGRDHFE